MRKNKSGLSTVVSALIMILLVMVATGIVWTIVSKIIKEEIESSESCFGNFEKVIIDNEYTCYNPEANEIQFSINIKDIDVDEVLVSISGGESTKSFKISKEEGVISYLKMYNGNENIILPGRNAGLTYVFNTGAAELGKPYSVKIAPIIGGNQCEISDSVSGIDDCRLLV